MMEKIGGRKVIALLIILVTAAATMAVKGDVPHNFLSILEFLFTGFVAGNVGEHVSGAIAAHAEAPKVNQVDLTPVVDSLSILKNSDETLASNIALVQQSLSMIINRTGIDKMPERQ